MEKVEQQQPLTSASMQGGGPRRPQQQFQGGGRGRGVPFSSAPEGVGEKYKRKDFTLGPLEPHEVRIASKSKISSCIQLAMEELNSSAEEGKVVLTACGHAIGVAVKICEILKRQVGGLHQVSDIGTVAITDEYEPLQDGLESVTRVRNVSFIRITLSKETLDTADPGYQPPIETVPEEAFEEIRLPRRTPQRWRGRQGLDHSNDVGMSNAMKATGTANDAIPQENGNTRGRRNNQRGRNPRRRGGGQSGNDNFGLAERAPDAAESSGAEVTTKSGVPPSKVAGGTGQAPPSDTIVTAEGA